MILAFALPRIVEAMTDARVRAFHAAEGTWLKSGGALCDLTVDLSVAAQQDCPPVSHYRIAIREAVWLRRIEIPAGELCEVGKVVALLSTEEHEPLVPAVRGIRHMVAGIILSTEEGLW
ncbi:MAG: hypothetical protein WDN25_03350 [Acetobacteraceae bacterium]